MSTEKTAEQLSKVHAEVLTANEAYAADFCEKANLGFPPARKFVILICMDARLDPAKYAGMAEPVTRCYSLIGDLSQTIGYR
jgi:hypothetical protein